MENLKKIILSREGKETIEIEKLTLLRLVFGLDVSKNEAIDLLAEELKRTKSDKDYYEVLSDELNYIDTKRKLNSLRKEEVTNA